MQRHVVVIGGGITGLAAAHRLLERDPAFRVTLLEAGHRLGGVLSTTREQGFLIEGAADGFVTWPKSAIDLCRRVGLEGDLIEPDDACRRALVFTRGRLHPVPMGFHLMAPGRFWPLASSPILSLSGKLRAAAELLIPARTQETDESLESFVRRRLGGEMFERLVQPLVGGIYAGDPGRLSIDATFPRFRQMEREHGSLLRAMIRSRRSEGVEGGARYGMFRSLRGGMQSLIDAIARRLGSSAIRLKAPVTSLQATASRRWEVKVGDQSQRIDADAVILAMPARCTAPLLESVDRSLSDELRGIHFAGCSIVVLGYQRQQIRHPLDAFGVVVPLVENRKILSCSFASVKYAERAPSDHVLLRVYIGGACQAELMQLPDDELIRIAVGEVTDMLGIHGVPVLQRVIRQDAALPQYELGHLERIERVQERIRQIPTLALAGSSLSGVGIPSCIQSGEAATDRVMNSWHDVIPLSSESSSKL